MNNHRTLIVAAAVFLASVGVSSARADAIRTQSIENANLTEQYEIGSSDPLTSQSTANISMDVDQFSVKETGSHIASLHIGPRLGVVGYDPAPSVATAPVPEPASMLLLGSGLTAVAGFGRRRFRKR